MHKRSSFVSDNDSVNVMTSGAAETWFETRLGAFTIRSAVEIRKTYCLVGSYVRLEVKGSSLYTHNKTSKSLRRNDVGVIVEVNDCRPPPQSRYLENEALHSGHRHRPKRLCWASRPAYPFSPV
jgi:hypothetical protein